MTERADPVRESRLLFGAWRAVSGTAAVIAALRAAASAPEGETRRDLHERLARRLVAEPGGLWLHAASVGEVAALGPLVDRLRARAGAPGLLVTTSTVTGRARAASRCGVPVQLAPLDAPGVVRRFLEQARPRGHVAVETELWPVRFRALADRGIPSALVSARLSPERLPRYRRVRSLYAPILSSLTLLAPASEGDAERLVELGADRARIGPVGNLKWDAAPVPPTAEECAALRASLGLDAGRRWVVLGSVHPGEAGRVVSRFFAETGSPRAGALVAPRHPQRFDRVADELEQAGYPAWRASQGPAPPGTAVILVDRMGLLAGLYALADAALLGGTLVPVGGHSPLEAAAVGCPLVAGPHVGHQLDLVGPLEQTGALVRVADGAEAARTLARLLADPAERRRAGDAARAEVARRRGHADRLAELVLEMVR